jgi:hypothetical protein
MPMARIFASCAGGIWGMPDMFIFMLICHSPGLACIASACEDAHIANVIEAPRTAIRIFIEISQIEPRNLAQN